MAGYNENYRYNYDYGVDNLNQQAPPKVDVAKIMRKMVQKWYYFAIAVPIFLLLGMVFLKSTPKIFLVGTTMMINPNVKAQSNLGANQYLPSGIQLQTSTDNIANEVGLLRSRNLIREAVAKLDFQIAYLEKDFFLTQEVYKKSTYPFRITLDYDHVQMGGMEFEVEPISTTTFTLRFKGDKYVAYHPGKESYRSVKAKVEYEEVHSFGKLIEDKRFAFTVDLREEGKFEDDTKYGFKVFGIEMLTDMYQASVDISRLPESNILSLTGESSTPTKLMTYLNMLAQTYIQRQLDKKNAYAEGTIEFINGQLSEVTGNLSEAEKNLSEVQRDAGGMDQTSSGELRSERNQLERQRDEERVKLNYLQNIKAKLSESNNVNDYVAAPSSAGINDPTLANLITQLSTLAGERIRLQASAGANSQEMINMDSQISNVKAQVRTNVENQEELVKLTLDRITGQIRRINGDINRIPTASTKTAIAKRKFDLNENLYNYLQQRLAEAEIQKAAADADSFVLDEARLLTKAPVSPKAAIILATMFILGIVLPAIVIIGMDFFNSKIGSEEEVKSLTDIPVVGTILHEKSPDSIFSEEYMLSPLAESFRYLKVNVDYLLSTEEGQNVVGITSMVKGEGKTFNSTNLASIIALSGKRTIIIGADIRRPQLYKRLRTENEIGLTNYLMGSKSIEEIIQQTSLSNLDMIASGPIPPNPIEMLNSSRFGVLIEALREEYEYVLVDTPPVGLVSDFLVLSKHTDVNLFVIRQNYSRQEFIRDLMKIRANNNLDNIYLVINDVKVPGKGYGSRYGQRYDYGYLDRGKGSSNGQLKKLKKIVSK